MGKTNRLVLGCFLPWFLTFGGGCVAERPAPPSTASARLEKGAGSAPRYQFSPCRSWVAVEDGFVPSRRLFVSPLGDDHDDGLSQEKALRTIGKAAAVVQPGDLVTVFGGTYLENVLVDKTMGTKEQPIVFRAAEDETALVTFAHVLGDWRKAAKSRFTYGAPSDCDVADVWDEQTLTRYVPLQTLEGVDKQPGSFYQDKNNKLYGYLYMFF